mgnify:CR=1 FL=1
MNRQNPKSLSHKNQIIINNKTFKIMEKKVLGIISAVVVLLLLIPFIAMQLTDEVNWTLLDFVTMGCLLFATGLACAFVIKRARKLELQITLCVAVLAVFFFIWAELAVGII